MKKVWIAIGSFVALIFIAQLYIDTESYLEPAKLHEKRVQINSSKLIGYDEGKISWEISSEEAWTGGNKYIFYLENLLDGRLFDSDGSLILETLRADEARVNSKSRTMIAKGNVYGAFIKDGDSSDPTRIRVQADELKYFSYNKRTYLVGNVKIERNEDVIYADKIELENDENILTITEGFEIENEEYIASANQMVIYIDDDEAELIGNVRLYRPPETQFEEDVDAREKDVRRIPAWIEADYLSQVELENDQSVTVISGNVVIRQEDKVMKGRYATFEKDKRFTMEGFVDVDLDHLRWALRPEKRDEVHNDDVEKRLSKPLYLNADFLDVDLEHNILKLRGDVVMIQDDTHTTCKVLVFDDENDELTLYQDVVLKRGEGDTLLTDAVTIDILSESFVTTLIPRIEEGVSYKSPVKISQFLGGASLDTVELEQAPDWINLEEGYISANAPIGARLESPYEIMLRLNQDGRTTTLNLTLLVTARSKDEKSYNELNQPELSFDLD